MSLAARSTAAELMDTGCVDFDDYARCLSDLARVNLITRTHQPLLAWLQRETAALRTFSLLDVACGHGDLLRAIHRQATHRGIEPRLHGIDLNPWSMRVALAATPVSAAITWHNGDVFAFEPDQPFDFIVSSQFTHHLTDQQVVAFISWMERHARHGWYVADLHRHWFPYYGFGLLAWAAGWHRFVGHDGRISIARSFRAAEWRRILQQAGLPEADVEIRWHLPFRLNVARQCLPAR